MPSRLVPRFSIFLGRCSFRSCRLCFVCLPMRRSRSSPPRWTGIVIDLKLRRITINNIVLPTNRRSALLRVFYLLNVDSVTRVGVFHVSRVLDVLDRFVRMGSRRDNNRRRIINHADVHGRMINSIRRLNGSIIVRYHGSDYSSFAGISDVTHLRCEKLSGITTDRDDAQKYTR